jgi:deoxyhypusine monooxygenase
MVRHEVRFVCVQFHVLIYAQAAEAMGAISSSSSLPVLKRYLNDSNRSVRETCEIAIGKIEWDHSEEGQRHHASTSDEPQSAKIRIRSASCFR